MGTLFVVATPIGNLQDVSARALRVLSEVSLIAAEDTRHTGIMLKRFGIDRPLVSYHQFNAKSRENRLLEALEIGDVALVTDAGTPAISDPGAAIVKAAAAAGHRIVPIPGASSVVAAVSASGLVEGPFTFLGFLPRKRGEREALVTAAASPGFPLVIFESANRVGTTLQELSELLGDREVVICRELTKLHEEIIRTTLGAIAKDGLATMRGEMVVVIGSPTGGEPDTVDPESLLRAELASGCSANEAAKRVAAITGRPKSELYSLALGIKDG